LQPGEVWVLEPASVILEYTPALAKANQILLDGVSMAHRLVYRVDQPFDCFVVLEALVNRLGRELNVIVLPFGPGPPRPQPDPAAIPWCCHQAADLGEEPSGPLWTKLAAKGRRSHFRLPQRHHPSSCPTQGLRLGPTPAMTAIAALGPLSSAIQRLGKREQLFDIGTQMHKLAILRDIA
jgi:hypothetical protein